MEWGTSRPLQLAWRMGSPNIMWYISVSLFVQAMSEALWEPQMQPPEEQCPTLVNEFLSHGGVWGMEERGSQSSALSHTPSMVPLAQPS